MTSMATPAPFGAIAIMTALGRRSPIELGREEPTWLIPAMTILGISLVIGFLTRGHGKLGTVDPSFDDV